MALHKADSESDLTADFTGPRIPHHVIFVGQKIEIQNRALVLMFKKPSDEIAMRFAFEFVRALRLEHLQVSKNNFAVLARRFFN